MSTILAVNVRMISCTTGSRRTFCSSVSCATACLFSLTTFVLASAAELDAPEGSLLRSMGGVSFCDCTLSLRWATCGAGGGDGGMGGSRYADGCAAAAGTVLVE